MSWSAPRYKVIVVHRFAATAEVMPRPLGDDRSNKRLVLNMHTYTSLSLIAAILLAAILGAVPAAVLTAGAGESTTFRYCVQHPGDHRLGMGNSTSNGLLNWRYMTGEVVDSSPVVANGIVYVGSNDSNVYALNATTGAKIWSYRTGYGVNSNPAIANGIVYVGSDDKNVYALNATTGTKVWSYKTGDSDKSRDIVWSSPAVAFGIVYVGSDDKNVYALNATTGTKVWSYKTGDSDKSRDIVWSSPAVAFGIVYVGSDDKNVYALNATTGTKVWSYKTGDVVDSSPVVTNGIVYVGSNDKNVYRPQCENRDEGLELHDRRYGAFLSHRRQRSRLCGELG